MKTFGGEVLFLDRDDINTDEIIPARYLTEATKAALKPYLLEDLSLDGFDIRRDLTGKAVVVTRANFGCGSSREHAPWALEANGIHVVVAESFARIFRQNMFNCGMLALALPADRIAGLFAQFAGQGARLAVNLDQRQLTFTGVGGAQQVERFELSPFDLELVKAGGWVEYADARY
jgi:3-isopropylmalate/(R)-2-methylmalate dehydratase small subunit